MSAAQVLAPALPAASPGVRTSAPGGATAERGDASFSDTLDQASRASEGQESEVRLSPDRMLEGGKGNGNTPEDLENGEIAVAGGAQVRVEVSASPGLSAMIAALGGVPAPASSSTAPATSSNVDANILALAAPVTANVVAGDEAVETGPLLPGQVGEAPTDAHDAERLLALLKAGASPGAAAAAAEPKNVDLKAAVTRRETHLALQPVQSAGPVKVTVDPATAAPQVDDSAATLGAALSHGMDEAGKPARAGGTVARDVEAKSDAPAATRLGVVGVEQDARGGSMLADQGISGQEGRQQESRSSTGAGSQQASTQNSGQFASAMTASVALNTAGAVSDAPDAGNFYEPFADQIAAGVRAELNADGMGSVSSDGVVKVLSIELKPANLGSVTVRIALKDNAITVHIETQQREALTAIDREKEALVGALAAAGYSVDSITTGQQSDASRFQGLSAALGDAGSSATRGGSQGQAGQGFSGSSGGEGRSNDSGSGNSHYRPPSDDNDVNTGGVRRDGGGLYV